MSFDQLLDDVQEELAALWGSGLSLPGPDRAGSLRALAARFTAMGLEWPAERLEVVAVGVDEGAPDAYDAMQGLAAWVRTMRIAWALQRTRDRLQSGPEGAQAAERRPRGFTGVVSLVGIERAGDRLLLHALSKERKRITLSDEVTEVEEREPLNRPVVSRLFQDRVAYGDVLAHDLRLSDHPKSGGRGPTVFGPAFYTRPQLVARDASARNGLPGGRIVRSTFSRVELEVRPGPDGWMLEHDGGDVTVTMSDVLAFNLAKWSALADGPLDAVVLGRGDGASILECLDGIGDRCFPAVDPMAIRWPWARVQAAAQGWSLGESLLGISPLDSAPEPWRRLLRWWEGHPIQPGGIAPPEPASGHWSVWTQMVAGAVLPDALLAQYTRTQLPEHPSLEEIAARGLCLGGASGRALVEAHASMLRRGVAHSGVLPDGWSLWALGDAMARLGGHDPRDRPVGRIELPWGPVWNGLVEVLGPWLRGMPVDDDEVAGALWLVRVIGEADRFWAGGPV